MLLSGNNNEVRGTQSLFLLLFRYFSEKIGNSQFSTLAVRVNSGTSLELRLYSGTFSEELRSQAFIFGSLRKYDFSSIFFKNTIQERSADQTFKSSCLYSTKGGRLFWDSRRTHVRHRLLRYHILPSRVVWLGGEISAISADPDSARTRSFALSFSLPALYNF